MQYGEILRVNRKVYDAMAAANAPLCRPATEDELANPLATVDAAGWLGPSIAGKNLLCLAAGGGRQSSLYAAAGARGNRRRPERRHARTRPHEWLPSEASNGATFRDLHG